jgi:hypothetical protein
MNKLRIGMAAISVCFVLVACGKKEVDEAAIKERNAEHIVPTEQKYTGPIIRTSKKVVDDVQQAVLTEEGPYVEKKVLKYLEQSKPAAIFRRDAHSKAHGCVTATVHVSDKLPHDVKGVGIFEPGEKYQAWIRYSSGNGMVQSDEQKDARGMAIKLMNVPGEKMLNSTHGKNDMTQDFLMINFPDFFLSTLEEYQLFAKLQADNDPFKYFTPGWNIFKWRWKQMWIGVGVLGQRPFDGLTLNPLYEHYHSMTPYALGVSAHGEQPREPLNVVRHSVEGVSCKDLESNPNVHIGKQNTKGGNFLRKNMNTHLDQAEACFKFNLHFQDSLKNMPIEDPTISWTDARVVHAATITIPKQQFDTDEQNKFCEDMAFSPWHGLPAHRPVGAINRIRKAVYEEISLYRHMRNVCPEDSESCEIHSTPRRRIFQPTGWCVTKNEFGDLIADNSCPGN